MIDWHDAAGRRQGSHHATGAATSAMRSGREVSGVMRTLGLIGGTGWVSTIEYYRGLNETVSHRLGGHEACRCILYSFNFGDVMRAKAGDPEQTQVRKMVLEAAGRLVAAGADGLMLCANTLHWFAEDVERTVAVPLVHIARAALTWIAPSSPSFCRKSSKRRHEASS